MSSVYIIHLDEYGSLYFVYATTNEAIANVKLRELNIKNPESRYYLYDFPLEKLTSDIIWGPV